MSNRVKWEFHYKAGEVALGARAQKEHRLLRVEFWTKAKTDVMAQIKESGLEINESAAANTAKSYTNAAAPTVSVRYDLQAKLTECHNKIAEHQKAVDAYGGWVQVLEANETAALNLTHDDWLYFFGKS